VELTEKRYKGGGNLRKLLSTRRGTTIVAALCTVIAAGILVVAAARYRHSVAATGHAETVLVASSVIQKGTPGDVVATQQMFHPQQVIAKQVTAGAVADTAALHDKVAATDIQPGQQITLSDFAASAGIVSQFAPNERAMSVPLDTSHGLTGVVKAGDRVDVYAGVDASVDHSNNGASAGAALRLLLPNVPVVAVNQNAGGGVGGNGVNTQADVVLKVKVGDAGALAFASDYGKVWLVLRGANAKSPAGRQATYTLNSLLLGSKPVNGGKP
jgi:Flp pilus assembly protein CpaB